MFHSHYYWCCSCQRISILPHPNLFHLEQHSLHAPLKQEDCCPWCGSVHIEACEETVQVLSSHAIPASVSVWERFKIWLQKTFFFSFSEGLSSEQSS